MNHQSDAFHSENSHPYFNLLTELENLKSECKQLQQFFAPTLQ